MFNRTKDPEIISEAIKDFADESFSLEDWLNDERNVALVDDGDVTLFEFVSPGVYEGHMFYESRGKEALKVADNVLSYVFSLPSFKVIIGLTPVDKLGARWLSRKIGFRSFGEVDTEKGKCELFILTKEQYEKGIE